jgi:acetyl-CoA C-acetyltransferase
MPVTRSRRARCSTAASRAGDIGDIGHGDPTVDDRLDHPGPDPPEDPMPEAVIVSTARSPIGRANKGSMVDLRPDDLAATIVSAALDKVPQLDRQTVEDVMIGCAQPAGEQGYNLGRVVALLAGMDDVPGTTVNRYCSSSLQTIRMAAHAIKSGEGDVFVAAGVECVSRFDKGRSDGNPGTTNDRFADARARTKARSEAAADPWTPAEGLPDLYIAMGQTAENVVQSEGVTREEMDEFAARSQQRAVESQHNGFFEREIIPVTLPDGTQLAKDDGPRDGTTVEKLAQLKPVFRPDGSVTAGNACPLNDGAAAVIVMSDTRAEQLGITPLARVVSSGVSGLNPEIMGLGPIGASRMALERAGLTIDDIDLVEINEAFAAQVIPSAKHLGIPMEKLNVHGGGIALGHPFGMTGARIMTTLLNGLEDAGGRYGLETMCVGGGQGMAMIVERLA